MLANICDHLSPEYNLDQIETPLYQPLSLCHHGATDNVKWFANKLSGHLIGHWRDILPPDIYIQNWFPRWKSMSNMAVIYLTWTSYINAIMVMMPHFRM